MYVFCRSPSLIREVAVVLVEGNQDPEAEVDQGSSIALYRNRVSTMPGQSGNYLLPWGSLEMYFYPRKAIMEFTFTL